MPKESWRKELIDACCRLLKRRSTELGLTLVAAAVAAAVGVLEFCPQAQASSLNRPILARGLTQASCVWPTWPDCGEELALDILGKVC